MDTAVKEPATVGEQVDNLPEPIKPGPLVHVAAVTPMQLLERAIERGMNVEQLTGLMALQERWETIDRQRRADEARSAFVAAMASFKAVPPTIVKDKAATFEKGANAKAAYMFASLAQVAAVIGAGLAKYGLSHRWITEQVDGGRVRVTCTITHVGGHSESATLEAAPDTSGSKNPIQAIGSTTAYLEKYTLCALTGLAASDQDDDAKASGAAEAISDEQKSTLIGLMRETEPDPTKLGARTERFLKFFKIASLDDLPASRFIEARDSLQEKANLARKPNAA